VRAFARGASCAFACAFALALVLLAASGVARADATVGSPSARAGDRCAALGADHPTPSATASAAPSGRKSGNGLARRELTEDERTRVAALDAAIAGPDEAARGAARYRRARIFYEANQWAEAARGFCDALERPHPTELSLYAAELLLDCLNALGWYDELERAAERYRAWPELAKDRSFVEICDRIRAGLWRMHAERLDHEERFAESAALYLRIADRFKSDPRLDEILYNAAVSFDRAGDAAAAAAARKRLIKIKPDSPLAKKAAAQLSR